MSPQQHLSRIRSLLNVELPHGETLGDSNFILRDSCEESWRRCFDSGLSPDNKPEVPQIEGSLLTRMQDEFGQQAFSYALTELNGLMNMVSEVGYSASLANAQGVIIAESVKPQQAFYCESDKLGSVWSEAVGGTNGIGTCIVEQRPVAIFRDDHFYFDLSSQACVAAPFYNPLGELQGVLNLTTCNPSVDINAHHIVYNLATKSSVLLEERLFIEHFRDYAILQLCDSSRAAQVIAVDELGIVRGASHAARRRLGLSSTQVGRIRLWEVIDCPQSTISLECFKAPMRARTLLRDEQVDMVLLRANRQEALSPLTEARARTVRSNVRPKEVSSSLARCAGQDSTMQQNVKLIRKVMNKKLPILLLGETGVGKDTLAKAIHDESDRCKGPYVAFNCAAVPESLIDSELFGYSKGAFTGASKEGSQGRLLEADGGTLFLDEIGDMPLSLQTRLLRVLESGEVSPLGAGKAVQVNLQIIAATNQRLHEKVTDGSFREDLFFRLAGMIVNIPPLRERDDRGQLIETVLETVVGDDPTPTMKPAAWKKLLDYSWPGNVRELKHVLHRASLFAEEGVISASDITLPFENRIKSIAERLGTPPASSFALPPAPVVISGPSQNDADSSEIGVDAVLNLDARQALAELEGQTIQAAMAAHGNNVDKAARSLGMSKATLYRKIKRYGIRNE
ncbi:sigma-54-dependent Fis family transcriptional regulator [Pseudomonas alliivorans]|uniref:Sigma-54-dependent Fis family transcriptional regulator n=1 Tax=Pseudomonas alliivorans TaxID=2810613 RepID=A0ABS4C7I7_9PSED|nr:sigma-54-dependent Fis family transcriptional regulator [Pseudomonas alliivorans]MBP0946556.1 sigma-54-dependent Fis family transcriptional regulator [Pseudomonas alliivorans]MEE4328531.1 sigma-54-dependent Fis family transcriptional regulator [Pseudomonas alliivorans]MEE4332754.1 sigma-54-dependent Fis family transcriptional regulator [Pseudomonas alliivorans]MEE4370359.1 sigma-54-dependent Fis family transcriptional regulator [Pseudomonas alliivorans]MEE4572343.1 sigma-54-dependent Fis fa